MTVVTDQERYRRVVEDGSRRKRDLTVYSRIKAERERERMAALTAAEQVAVGGWARAADRLRSQVPESTFRLWLAPLVAVAADGTTLILDGPEGIRAWAERRYSSLIGEALQGTGFERVEFVQASEVPA
jgi:hypothetical protein